MDVSVLPNNNHPDRFLQLDAGMLPASHSMFQLGAVMTSQRHWQNRVYSQVRAILLTSELMTSDWMGHLALVLTSG